ncbi:hypothetical protein PsYK624_034260 [Phanerochaete sordida]|uniref:Heterokaryon incompatibility domain-containing protein n=1 Tax=Phanerochaete sordida TaxID=48140 RepID=A0A9P3LAU5_9APHY|nr:hypothetical protein PsYK624_034260 [Phanerochaete sordida]
MSLSGDPHISGDSLADSYSKLSLEEHSVSAEVVPEDGITFTVGDASLLVERPPWLTHPPRSRSYDLDTSYPRPFEANEARLRAWGQLKLAESKLVAENRVLASSGQGKIFTLVPEPRTSIPLQWSHTGPGAIPNSLADTPSSTLGADEVLAMLNDVFGTSHSLSIPGLPESLKHLLRVCRDFGEVYGYVRGYWRPYAPDFQPLIPLLEGKRADEESSRRSATQGGYISHANVHTRRAWDLYSNRVLPIHVLSAYYHDIWPVSHSWVQEDAREQVWTNINGREWPVPVPRGTSLEHVRVELLNLGAEYVWLDVVCLRQRGRDEDEDLRKEEWKLDVPTAGYAYSHPFTPCITYFNGLGLPFASAPDVLTSARHWCNRVWTAQEASPNWLPGGMTGAASARARAFFAQRHRPTPALDLRTHPVQFISVLLAEVRARRCTNAVDALVVLAHAAQCQTLLVYAADAPLEDAWTALLKHLPPKVRGGVFLRQLVHHPAARALFPRWAEFRAWDDAGRDPHTGGRVELHLADSACRGAPGPGMYYQKVDSLGVCGVAPRGDADDEAVELRSMNSDDVGSTEASHIIHGTLRGDIPGDESYLILRLTPRTWLIADEVGTSVVEEEYLDSAEFCLKRREVKAVRVRKRGVILLQSPPESLPLNAEMYVSYLEA